VVKPTCLLVGFIVGVVETDGRRCLVSKSGNIENISIEYHISLIVVYRWMEKICFLVPNGVLLFKIR